LTSSFLKPVIIIAFGEEENLGVGYLLSVLAGKGIPGRMIDIRYEKEEILGAIRREDPVLVGFSVIFENCLDDFARLVRYLRSSGVGCHFTAGGFYASLYPEELFRFLPELDSVVRFEGEYTLPDLVQCLMTGSEWRNVQSLAYPGNGKTIRTPLRRLERDLDKFPLPVRGRPGEYVPGLPYASLITGRGCIHNCSFCNTREFYSQAGGPVKRIRRPGEVVREMHRLYAENGCRIFLFQDDDTPVKVEGSNGWMKLFCDEIERQGMLGKVIWKINCRPDEIEAETFSMMKSYGLFLVFVGLEDGTDEGLKALNKKMKVSASRRGIGILQQLGLSFDYGFILFQPESSFASLRENIRFLSGMCSDNLIPMAFLKLIPCFGTRVERELRESGRLRGRPGKLEYSFRSESLDACWTSVSHCFAEWQWGREGVVNLAKWLRNYIAVHDYFRKPDRDFDHYRTAYMETVTGSNRYLEETMSGLFDYYESGDYLSDSGRRMEEAVVESEQVNQLYSGRLKEMLTSLRDESWR
jgi:radical SAM superfamily enzyme YgiQ (UPF0313 family)